jgi:hypothetical protein
VKVVVLRLVARPPPPAPPDRSHLVADEEYAKLVAAPFLNVKLDPVPVWILPAVCYCDISARVVKDNNLLSIISTSQSIQGCAAACDAV